MTYLHQNTENSFRLLPSATFFLVSPRLFRMTFCNFAVRIHQKQRIMNKKERFCDVDNIVEWRHIITTLLAVVSLGASAQLESVKELSMKSEYFNHERQVLIYTPSGYQ